MTRLLSDEEIKEHLYIVSTSRGPLAFTERDGTLLSPNVYSLVRIEGLLQAQDLKTASELIKEIGPRLKEITDLIVAAKNLERPPSTKIINLLVEFWQSFKEKLPGHSQV